MIVAFAVWHMRHENIIVEVLVETSFSFTLLVHQIFNSTTENIDLKEQFTQK